MLTPKQAVDAINRRFGSYGARAMHAKGTLLKGTFTASEQAARLTKAANMQGDRVDATARVSNGSGDPHAPDYGPEVRGLAVKFYLPDGERTDISAQTVPRFPVRTPDAFVNQSSSFSTASRPGQREAPRLPVSSAAIASSNSRFVSAERPACLVRSRAGRVIMRAKSLPSAPIEIGKPITRFPPSASFWTFFIVSLIATGSEAQTEPGNSSIKR